MKQHEIEADQREAVDRELTEALARLMSYTQSRKARDDLWSLSEVFPKLYCPFHQVRRDWQITHAPKL